MLTLLPSMPDTHPIERVDRASRRAAQGILRRFVAEVEAEYASHARRPQALDALREVYEPARREAAAILAYLNLVLERPAA